MPGILSAGSAATLARTTPLKNAQSAVLPQMLFGIYGKAEIAMHPDRHLCRTRDFCLQI
jgi:hypothetical protein